MRKVLFILAIIIALVSIVGISYGNVIYYHELTVTSVNSKIERIENDEIICYTYSDAFILSPTITCKWKDLPQVEIQE